MELIFKTMHQISHAANTIRMYPLFYVSLLKGQFTQITDSSIIS